MNLPGASASKKNIGTLLPNASKRRRMLLNLADRFAPYGNENEQLCFLAKNLTIEDLNFIGKVESKHLKMALSGGKYKWPALYWDAAVRVMNKEFGKGDHVDAVFNVTRDWYKGIATPQMMIVDLMRNEKWQ
jgi:single-stranded-DNA-specific exonuclease